MMSDFALPQKLALVTGSSRGIGAATATALTKAGARCLINFAPDPQDQNRADAERLASALPGGRTVQCDVSDPTQVAAMMDMVRRDFGALDILVNNAGILRDRSLKKMTQDDWNTVLGVNLTGTFNCIRQATPLLRPGGRIVNIASLSGCVAFFGQAAYAASKAGVMALTRAAAIELARQQITANAVAPGVVADTEMSRAIPEEARQALLAQVPLQRFATPADIAATVLFLCSPAAAYITGQVIHVNGGTYMP
jgi:3-oxoacyl-[acyl-carrier protein] reductase